jgi:hypothetical protein
LDNGYVVCHHSLVTPIDWKLPLRESFPKLLRKAVTTRW